MASKLELAIHPPIVWAACATMMLIVTRAFPAAVIGIPDRRIIALVIFIFAILIAALAVGQFTFKKTTVDPTRPQNASALVTNGVYRISRNPMYLALLLILVAVGIRLDNWAALTLLPLFPLWITRFQIIPEERRLASRFGEELENYRKRTRRWI